MWHVYNGLSWPTIETISKGWANDYERALARDYVNRLRQVDDPAALPEGEAGVVYFELTSRRADGDPLENALRKALNERPMLGLAAREGVPMNPEGPNIAIRVRLDDDVARVQFSSTKPTARTWLPLGKLEIPLLKDQSGKDKTTRPAAELADALADALLGRLVDATLIPGKKVNSKTTYKLRIDNGSPLILNGLALTGAAEHSAARPPSSLAGMTLTPHRSITLPASAAMVESLGLKNGVDVIAVDLSGL
jgi:hypothetical protein